MNIFNLKKNLKLELIIILFTLSIFFWSVEVYGLQFRFSYLVLFIFLSFSLINWKKIFIPLAIVIHSIFFSYYFGKSLSLVYFSQLIVLILTTFIVYDNFQLFTKNLEKIITYFFIILIFLLIKNFFLNYDASTIKFDCALGCFSNKKIIFSENSHFAISIIPVLIYLALSKNNIYGIWIKIFIQISLITIAFFNFSSTLFLGLVSLCIIFLIFEWKNSNSKQKKNIFILFLFAILIFLVNNKDITSRFDQIFTFDTYKIKNQGIIFEENENNSALKENNSASSDQKKIVKIKDKKNTLKLNIKEFVLNDVEETKEDDIEETRGDAIKKVLLKHNKDNKKKFDFYDGAETKEEEITKLYYLRIDKDLPSNMSTDILIKSLKISYITLKNYPLGVGLNNFEIAHNLFIDQVYTKYFLSKKFNMQDGANNLNKILAEFGIFSILFIFVMMKFFFKKSNDLDVKYFLFSFIFVQTFIRGVGYFNAGFFIIFLIICFVMIKKN